VFAILQEVIPQGVDGQADPDTGRRGLAQWKILVLGTLRLGLNADHDRLQELANQHNTIRQMLGHSDWADATYYELQTLKDNLRLFTPDILDRINQEVVRAGHQALKKSPEDGVEARADSFVVKTNVHYPTDINLLLDAIRKTIDEQIAVSLVVETQGRFHDLRAISMDKGFHSPRNQTELKGLLERVVLPIRVCGGTRAQHNTGRTKKSADTMVGAFPRSSSPPASLPAAHARLGRERPPTSAGALDRDPGWLRAP
jgi:hypothetical protein